MSDLGPGGIPDDELGLDGLPDELVAYADELLAVSNSIMAEAARQKLRAVTATEWIAAEQIEHAAHAVYSAQCWLLRAAVERRDGRQGQLSE